MPRRKSKGILSIFAALDRKAANEKKPPKRDTKYLLGGEYKASKSQKKAEKDLDRSNKGAKSRTRVWRA